jgi:hypothetical protein
MPTVTLDVNGTVMIGGNLKITGANLASNITDGNINLTPNGSGIVVVTTGLYVSANANVGNLNTNGNINSAANIVGANITANSNIYSPAINNGNSNVRIAANSNVSVSVAGTSNVFVVTNIGANISGNLDITGNISANNFSANALTANSMSNGNSNVRISANANVTVSANGAANVLSISEAGANISGTANITGNISTAGNVNLTASGARIRGDFSNGSAAGSRLLFQTSIADSLTGIGAIPSGTGQYAAWTAYGSSDPNNSSFSAMHVDMATTHVGLNSGHTGTGTTLPLVLQVDNANILLANSLGITVTGVANISGNANVGNLGTATAIISTGNITTINSGLMQNGNSNVSITANGNVTVTATSTATLVVTATGANITGTANVSGNANVGNLGTSTAIISTGNITTINSGLVQNGTSNVTLTTNGNISTFIDGNVTAQLVVTATGANIAGTANVVGNANVGNLGTATAIISTGNITTINSGLLQNGTSNVTLTTSGNVSTFIGGNVTAQLVVTGTGANIAGTANVVGNANVGNIGAADAILTSNIQIGGNSIKSSTGNVAITLADKDVTIEGNLDVKGTVTLIESTTITVNDKNVVLGNTASTGAALDGGGIDLGNNALVTFRYNNSTTSWQSNVALTPTANGTLTLGGTSNYWGNAYVSNLLASGTANIVGNANVGNLGTTTAIITTGNITTINSGLLQNGTSNVTLTTSGNISTFIAGNATAQLVVTSTGANIAGTANIVGNANVGNLGVTQVIATGNITGGNLLTSGSGGNISGANVVLANTFTSNVTNGTAPFVINSNTQVVNLNAAVAGSLINGNSNVSIPSANGNVIVSVGGTVNVQIWSTAGANITGTLGVSGNANVGNLGTATAIITTGNITTINSGLLQNSTSNVTIASAGNVSTFVAGNVTAQLVVTSTGANIAGTANVVGNANLGNVGTNILLATGNVTGANFLTTGNANIGNVYINDKTISTLLTNANLNINANGSGYITLNAAQNSANVVINGSTANLLYVDGVNNSIGVLTNTIPTNVTVKVNSTNSVIMPVGNSVQRPSTPIQAMFRFNTDTLNYEFYDGSQWKQASSTFTVVSADEFIGDGLTSVYTLSQSSTTNATLVSVDGNVQVPTTAYTVSSTTLTFNPGYVPGAGTKVDLRVITTSTTVTRISDGDTSVAVTDTGSDGTVTITADGSSRLIANTWINANAAIVSRLAGTSVGAAAVVIDTFDKTLFRSAKYVVQVSNSGRGDYETSEYIATHNGTTAYGTSYGIVYSNVELGNVSVAINSGNVELTYTGNYAGNTVKLFKEYIPV